MHTEEALPARADRAARDEQITALRTAVFLPESDIARCVTFRDAVWLAFQLRRPAAMTKAGLAAQCGVHAPHMTQFVNPSTHDGKGKKRADLPAAKIAEFEAAVGNRAVSQWLNRHARLNIMEEMIAARS